MNKADLVVFLVLAAVLSGCQSIESARYSHDKPRNSGIPYNLPRSDIKVSVRVNRNDPETGLTLATTSEIVPDHKAVFYARPDLSIWTDSDHHIVLENGLLHSVDTIDDGQAGEVLNNVAQTVVNLQKIGAARAESAVGSSPFTSAEPYPTVEEIRAILALVEGGQFTFEPSSHGKSAWMSVPGTAEILRVKSELVGSVPSPKPAGRGVDKYRGGVFTRTLRGSVVASKVAIDMEKLRERRIAVTSAECEESERDRTLLERQKELQKARTEEACKHRGTKQNWVDQLDMISRIGILDGTDTYAERKAFLEEQLGKLAEKESKCIEHEERLRSLVDNWVLADQKVEDLSSLLADLKATQNDRSFVLSSRNDRVMVVDTSRTLRVPIRRAWVGQTVNNLRFEKGVLTDFHQTKPAETLVATQAMVKTSQTLFDGLLEVLGIPRVILGIEKDEKTAEIALTEQEIRLLQQRLNVVATETEIAEMKAQVQLILQQAQLEQIRQNPEDHLDKLEDDDESDEEEPDPDPGPDPGGEDGMDEGDIGDPGDAGPGVNPEDNGDQVDGMEDDEGAPMAVPSPAVAGVDLSGTNIAGGEEAARQALWSILHRIAMRSELAAANPESGDEE